MTIRTGYFARIEYYKSLGFIPVSIARWTPRWYQGFVMTDLAPSAILLHRYKQGTLTKDQYIEWFNSQLNSEDPERILKRLSKAGDKIVLCCYEKPSDFCHRHLVTEWFRNHGVDCYELS